MKVSVPDFLMLNSDGINLFIKMVDQMYEAKAADGTYQGCVKDLQARIRTYIEQKDAWAVAPTVAPLPSPLTFTMGKLLERRTCNNREYRALRSNIVYVIRDEDKVLYVGVTRYDARSRIKSHQKAHSQLGEALRNRSNVDSWTVEMIPHADSRTAIEKEKQLIGQLRPRFNLR